MKKYLLWIILAAALAVRLVYFFQINDHFLFNQPILDAKYYHDWALEIARGNLLGLERGVFMMSPGYSYFLAGVYGIFNNSISVVVIIQFALGLITGYLLFLLGRKLFSQTAGYLAMCFYLFYSLSIFYESTLLKSTLINFVNILSIYLVISASPPALLISGALIGFSVHLRPNILVFIPVVILWLRLKDKKYIHKSIYFVLGITIMLLPVALRNSKAGGEFVFSTAHGGMNLYTGNSQYCKGPYTPMPFARTDPEVEQQDFLLEAQRRSGRELTPKESSSFWYKQSVEFIINNPAQWLKLMFRKFLVFINAYEPPINLDYYFFKQEYNSILSAPMFGYGLILPLAVAGLIAAPVNLLLAGYLAVYFLVSVVFFVVSEYRFPVVPILCLYAGFGFKYIISRKPSKKHILPGIIFVLFVMLVNSDIYSNVFGYPKYRSANLANSYFGLGVTYEDRDMQVEAVNSYKKAIDVMPQSAPMINLANIYEGQGRLDDAFKLYEQAIRVNRTSAEAFNNLGSIYFKKANYKAAAGCFAQALKLKPHFKEAAKNLKVTEQVIKMNGNN